MLIWKETVSVGGRTLELESGRIAKQAHGAVLVKDGRTVLLATAAYGDPRAEADFFPLTVDYREYLSAGGRIPGGFLKREARANDTEVLNSRFCDRSLRPLFPKGFRAETQVIITVLSYDPESDPGILAIIGAAAALHISEIPWNGPLAALRVVRQDGELKVLPTPAERERAELDLVVSLSREGVVMLEGGAQEVPDADVVAAIAHAQEEAQPLLALMDRMRDEIGREKAELPADPPPPAWLEALQAAGRPALTEALAEPAKLARHKRLRAAKAQIITSLQEQLDGEAPSAKAIGGALEALEGELLRADIVEKRRRVDGRAPEDIRPITCEVDWLPSTHGSALFTRGETQAVVSLTLGSQQDRMLIETVSGVRFERFLLHYNFPPYSVGEVRPLRGPGRREVGHGALARRALEPVLPKDADFPYTVRIVSEITESNGSSSMATVCGGTLALMDGGVPLKAPVAGIAMGLVKEGDKLVVLRDILGDEDHLGDMDFKVAGTTEGVTAVQMDNKIGSLPPEVMQDAFEQARQGRLHILGEMKKVLAQPRPSVKDHVPLLGTVTIASNRVRDLIGPGGRVIQEIQRTHSCKIEVDESGLVRIYAPNRAALEQVREAVLEKAGTLEVDSILEGTVINVKDFGAFVRVRGQDGLVHRSEWAFTRVEDMTEVAKVGDVVRVKVLAPDKAGRLSLSRKAAL